MFGCSSGVGDAYILQGAPMDQTVPEAAPSQPALTRLRPATWLDASRGLDYRAAHIEGAHWVQRAHLWRQRPYLKGPITVVGRDAALVYGVQDELVHQGHRDVEAIPSGPTAIA